MIQAKYFWDDDSKCSVIDDMDLPHTYTPQGDYGEKPKQYASLKTDTFKRMAEDASNEERIGFVRGNIDKYNWRNKGTDKEDLKKIIAYAKWALNNIDYD